MLFLLRVSLPDVRGSLGRVASAIGDAGGDIEAIEIVEKVDGYAIDDVLLSMASDAMPDSVVSACSQLPGVKVLWIGRYGAAGNLFMDLEVIEELTSHPEQATERVVDMVPKCFHADWALHTTREGRVIRATEGAPTQSPHHLDLRDIETPSRVPDDDVNVYAAAPFGADVVVIARRGGPEFLDSELARLRHLLVLAMSIQPL